MDNEQRAHLRFEIRHAQRRIAEGVPPHVAATYAALIESCRDALRREVEDFRANVPTEVTPSSKPNPLAVALFHGGMARLKAMIKLSPDPFIHP